METSADNDRAVLEQAQMMAMVIWGALLSSLGIYVLAYMYLLDKLSYIELEPKILMILSVVLTFASIYILFSAPSIYRKALASAYEKVDMTGAELAPVAASTYILAMIIPLALYESIAIFGFVLASMGAGQNVFIGFMGASAVAMITAKPKMETLKEHFEKTMAGLKHLDK
jgi:hypothetical protein